MIRVFQGRTDSSRVPAVCHVIIMLRLPGVRTLGNVVDKREPWSEGSHPTFLHLQAATCSRHVATRPSIPKHGLAVPAARSSEEMRGKKSGRALKAARGWTQTRQNVFSPPTQPNIAVDP